MSILGRHVLRSVLVGWIALGCGQACAETIIIGQTLPLSGRSNVLANELAAGRAACLAAADASSTSAGRTLRLVTLDDRGNSQVALKNAISLMEQSGAVALFGPMGTSTSSELLPWALRMKMPVVGPYGGDVASRSKDWATTFFVTANLSAEAQRIAEHLASLGTHKVAVAYSEDPDGKAELEAFEEGLAVTGLRLSMALPVKVDGSDLPSIMKRISSANPEVVLLATTGATTIATLKAMEASRMAGAAPTSAYTLSSGATQDELSSLGSAARGLTISQVVPSPYDTTLPVIVTYQAAMRVAGHKPSYASLEGCLDALTLVDVLKRKEGEVTRSGLLKALRSTGVVKLGGFEIDLADRDKPGSKFTDIVLFGNDGRVIH